MGRRSMTPTVRDPLLATVDTIAARLQRRPTEAARADAANLYDGLRTWTDTSAQYAYRFAAAQWALYNTKRRTGAPSFEQNLALRNAVDAAQVAADRQTANTSYYHDAHRLLLDALLVQKKYEAVVETATSELQSKSVPATEAQRTAYREILAEAYRGQEKYELAIREYRKLVSANPERQKYRLALADVLVENGSYAKAKTLYQKLRTQNPKDARLVARIGELELKRGNFSEASLQLEKALDMNPDLTGVRGLLGEAYDGASNYSKAIDAYQAAVQELQRRMDSTQTGSPSVGRMAGTTERLSSHLQSLGRVHMQIGQYDEAAGAFKHLTEVASSNAAAWHGLGQAYLQSGRVYEALSALNRALTLNKTSQEISKDLSRARSLRDKISKNRPPIEMVDTNVDELYPSLYKNYSNPSKLPIGAVVLANNTNVPKPNATLTFYVEGLMDEPTEQKMKPLSSYSNTTIPLRAVFNESILQVTEQQTMQARLRLTYQHQGESEIVERSVSFTLQSRNAIKWKDKRRLAAFINPRDPELIDYTKTIDRLFRSAPTYDLPTNVVTALQTFTVLTNQGYTYSVDPETDFSVVSRNPEMLDYCQYPEQTIQRKAGDCDDLVTLYLSMLSNAGVPTGYVDIPGHVMSAFDTGLSPDELTGSALSREDVVVSQDKVWIPVETTLLGSESFLTAWRKGVERYRKEQREGDLPQIISIANARTVYDPSSIEPESFDPSLSDTSQVLADYKDQVSTLYARQTEAQRRRLSEQLDADPNNTFVRNRLGILHARAGQPEKARQLYEKGLDLTPTNALLLNNYANVLYQQGRYEKAVDLYRRSLKHGEEDPQIYINLCKAQLALGRSQEAASSFEAAIQRDPSLSETYSYLQKRL
jgi:tetratricopeptide (TPR) repeat protein